MNPRIKKVVLFANGELAAPDLILLKLSDSDFMIAVDGGLAHMTRLGLTPDMIIGDMDSANEADVQQFKKQGVEVQKHPVEKNETDLELALEAAHALNPSIIWILGALGKRLDQTLGNIFLLTRSDFKHLNIRLVDGHQEVFLIQHSATINGKTGQRVSLIPLGGSAAGIHTKGLKYALTDETLYPDRTRGISNQMLDDTANITLKQGQLLCIHETQEPQRSD